MPIAGEIQKDFLQIMEELQDDEKYPEIILRLRRAKKLHPFVEFILDKVITEHFPGRFSLHPEKYGISNGRIDMAAYAQSRTVIHFELIATSKNDHVFRDTSSLLASKADEKLAILIDEDISPDVARNFFKAIPNRESQHLFLRDLLVKSKQSNFVKMVKDLVVRAEFKNGTTNPSGFYCETDSSEIEIYSEMKVRFFNAPVDAVLTLQLQQHESMSKTESLGSTKTASADGYVDITIPFMPNAPGEQYFIAAHLSTGELWRKRVFIRKPKDSPIVFVANGIFRPEDSVSFSVSNFPSKVSLRTILSNGSCGQGTNHGEEVTTDDNGKASGTFTIPQFICDQRTSSGLHKVIVSTEGSRCRAQAEGQVEIRVDSPNSSLKRPMNGAGWQNHFVSILLRTLEVGQRQLEIEYEIVNVNNFSIAFSSSSVSVTDKAGKMRGLWVGGSFRGTQIPPGAMHLARDKFISQDTFEFDTNSVMKSWIRLILNFHILREPEVPIFFSLEPSIVLRDDEENLLLS